MHTPDSIQENETHKILWKFEIQTEYPIQVRKTDLSHKLKEKTMSDCGFH